MKKQTITQSIVDVLLWHKSVGNYGAELYWKKMDVIWSIILQISSDLNSDKKLKNSLVDYYLKNMSFGQSGFVNEVDKKIIKIIFTEFTLSKKQIILLLNKIDRDLGFNAPLFFSFFESLLEDIDEMITSKTNWNHRDLIKKYLKERKNTRHKLIGKSLSPSSHYEGNTNSHIGRH